MTIQEKVSGWFSQSLSGVSLAAQGGMGIVKKGWTIFALCGALACAAGYILYLNHKTESVAEEMAKVQEQADLLAKQSADLIELNKQNSEVYAQLQDDRTKMAALVTNFNYQLQANAQALSKIGNNVSKLEDGNLAPILKETVRQLQQLRETRDIH